MAMVLTWSLVPITFLNSSLGLRFVSLRPAGVVRPHSGLSLLTLFFIAFLFNIVATGQMYIWAVKKHKSYKKDFKEYPRNRSAMFPFIA